MTKRAAPNKKRLEVRDRPAVPIPSILQIVVECNSEPQQQDLYERLKKEGYRCRVLTL